MKGGGCHGYQYGMSLKSTMGEDDTVVEHGVVKVIMDSQSAPLLVGTEVDYVDSMQGVRFCDEEPASEDHVWMWQFLQRLTPSGVHERRSRCISGVITGRSSQYYLF